MNSSLRIFALCALVVVAFGTVSEEEFFPFGPDNGDSVLETGDDVYSEPIKLHKKFPIGYDDDRYDTLYVDNNGVLSFQNPVTAFTPICRGLTAQFPLVMPFWADVDTSQGLGGAVYYRDASNDSTVLKKAAKEIQTAYPKVLNLQLKTAVIATWYQVPFAGAAACGLTNETVPRNTFQAVLAATDFSSWAISYYGDIAWTTGRNSGGDCSGLGGSPARAGFDAAEGFDQYIVPHSCNDGILNITETSDYNQPGKWTFTLAASCGADGCNKAARVVPKQREY